jgi:hypothetical protein
MYEKFLFKEKSVVQDKKEPVDEKSYAEKTEELGSDLLKMLNERTENPRDAFVLLQQLSIYLWDVYKIDWTEKEGQTVDANRKQRYINFISGLIDMLVQPESSEPAKQ